MITFLMNFHFIVEKFMLACNKKNRFILNGFYYNVSGPHESAIFLIGFLTE